MLAGGIGTVSSAAKAVFREMKDTIHCYQMRPRIDSIQGTLSTSDSDRPSMRTRRGFVIAPCSRTRSFVQRRGILPQRVQREGLAYEIGNA
jgi:hypothetical protein